MKVENKKAFFEYELLERFEAGISLTGAEVKAVRLGHVDLLGSFVKIVGSQAFLLNAKIFPYKYARPENYDEKRSRKLLLHKKEIMGLKSKIEASSLTIVPVSLYNKGQLIKAQLALAKGKKQYQKKEAIKKRDLDRETEAELANRSAH